MIFYILQTTSFAVFVLTPFVQETTDQRYNKNGKIPFLECVMIYILSLKYNKELKKKFLTFNFTCNAN